MECVVCTELLDKSVSSCIPCGHVLHLECLGTWLTEHKSCPMCRKQCDLSDMTILYLPKDDENQQNCITNEAIKKKWDVYINCAKIEKTKHIAEREHEIITRESYQPIILEPRYLRSTPYTNTESVGYLCDCDGSDKWGRTTIVHPAVIILLLCLIFGIMVVLVINLDNRKG